VQVVVVVGQGRDHLGRSVEPGPGADEDVPGAGANEPVDQVLGQAAVDLADPGRDRSTRISRSVP
jgi:hypothetical protein